MKLARLAVVLLFATLAMPAAHAAEPTIDEKIETILDVTGLLDEMVTASVYFSAIQAVSGKYDASAEPIVRSVILREIQKIRPETRTIFIDVWKETSTEEEIDAWYAFVTSPGGRSAIAKQRVFHDRLTQALNSRNPSYVDEIVAALAAEPELQKLKK